MTLDKSMLIAGDCVIEDRTFETNFYRPNILPHIDVFKSLIVQGGGEALIKMRDIRNMIGYDKCKNKADNNMYLKVRDTLLEFGIKVKMYHNFGLNLIMTFADDSEIVKAIDVTRKREANVAQKAGFLNWNEYCKNKPSYRAARMTDMRYDEDNQFHFVYIGRKYIAQELFPGAIINEKSLGGKYSSISGYDWTINGVKVKHFASRLRHSVDDEGFERDYFQWGILNNNVADAFLLTGWGSVGSLNLMKAWIIDAKEIVNRGEFWNRSSFLISTHDRSIKKYSKFEVNDSRLEKIRKSLADREELEVYPGIIEKIEDLKMDIRNWYNTYFR